MSRSCISLASSVFFCCSVVVQSRPLCRELELGMAPSPFSAGTGVVLVHELWLLRGQPKISCSGTGTPTVAAMAQASAGPALSCAWTTLLFLRPATTTEYRLLAEQLASNASRRLYVLRTCTYGAGDTSAANSSGTQPRLCLRRVQNRAGPRGCWAGSCESADRTVRLSGPQNPDASCVYSVPSHARARRGRT